MSGRMDGRAFSNDSEWLKAVVIAWSNSSSPQPRTRLERPGRSGWTLTSQGWSIGSDSKHPA